MMTSLRSRIGAHPIGAFFVLAFAIPWTLMTPAMIAGLDSLAAIPFFVGVFGPFIAAATVTRSTGTSVRAWLRDVLRPRQSWRWYAGVIAFPVALAVVASVEFAFAGREPRFPPRRFALPRLLERFSPVRATVLLGFAWGLWHLPLLSPSTTQITTSRRSRLPR